MLVTSGALLERRVPGQWTLSGRNLISAHTRSGPECSNVAIGLPKGVQSFWRVSMLENQTSKHRASGQCRIQSAGRDSALHS